MNRISFKSQNKGKFYIKLLQMQFILSIYIYLLSFIYLSEFGEISFLILYGIFLAFLYKAKMYERAKMFAPRAKMLANKLDKFSI